MRRPRLFLVSDPSNTMPMAWSAVLGLLERWIERYSRHDPRSQSEQGANDAGPTREFFVFVTRLTRRVCNAGLIGRPCLNFGCWCS